LSVKPILGADGRTVIFQSYASDLVENDFNSNRDIFVLRLGAGDSDGDGLEDDWELAYFGTLGRDGSGDFDGDGHTDRQEFSAGTDPTNRGSILRALTLTSFNGATTILWSASPGRTYQVQFKDDLNHGEWTDLAGLVTAHGSTASAVDPFNGTTAQKYYRITLVP
jgi:hypothetical protein